MILPTIPKKKSLVSNEMFFNAPGKVIIPEQKEKGIIVIKNEA